jgi:hypothetical protein
MLRCSINLGTKAVIDFAPLFDLGYIQRQRARGAIATIMIRDF